MHVQGMWSGFKKIFKIFNSFGRISEKINFWKIKIPYGTLTRPVSSSLASSTHSQYSSTPYVVPLAFPTPDYNSISTARDSYCHRQFCPRASVGTRSRACRFDRALKIFCFIFWIFRNFRNCLKFSGIFRNFLEFFGIYSEIFLTSP